MRTLWEEDGKGMRNAPGVPSQRLKIGFPRARHQYYSLQEQVCGNGEGIIYDVIIEININQVRVMTSY